LKAFDEKGDSLEKVVDKKGDPLEEDGRIMRAMGLDIQSLINEQENMKVRPMCLVPWFLYTRKTWGAASPCQLGLASGGLYCVYMFFLRWKYCFPIKFKTHLHYMFHSHTTCNNV
jgi:hypothetical protein